MVRTFRREEKMKRKMMKEAEEQRKREEQEQKEIEENGRLVEAPKNPQDDDHPKVKLEEV